MEELKYPIGRFKAPETYTQKQLEEYISTLESFPQKIKQEVENLNAAQLDTPYRLDGWTIRQVVNHCSDSHMNGFIRLKLALTEENPVIKPYVEYLWSELADAKQMPIAPALTILEGVHARWTVVLRSMNNTQWKRRYFHPEKGTDLSMKESTANYAWHCEHHLAHITRLKERMGWI